MSERIPICLELGAPLAVLAQDQEVPALGQRLRADVDVLLDVLGIAADASVEVQPVISSRPLRVRVHGMLQPYSPNLMLRAWLAVAPPDLRTRAAGLAGLPASGFPGGWVEECVSAAGGGERPDGAIAGAFVQRLAFQIILKRPSCLLGPRQVDGFAPLLEAPRDEVAAVLPALLDLGVSIANVALLRRLLAEGRAIGRSWDDTVEAAFIELRSDTVEIHVHPETLRALLPGSSLDESFSVYAPHIGDVQQQLFRMMEETFFTTFGLRLPQLKWVPTPGLPRATFALKLGAWWSLPVHMLPPGQRLVDTTPEELDEYGARDGVHPASGAPCALVNDRFKEPIEEQGIPTWGPIDFVILTTLAELSRRPGRLLAIEDVEYELVQLENIGFRDVVQLALARFTLGDLTRVFRALLDERISIRDLRGLVERLLQFDTVEPASDDLQIVDQRLPVKREGDGNSGWPEYYAFVRRELQGHLSHKYTWYEKTIVAYAIAPQLEARLSTGPGISTEAEIEGLRDVVWRELQAQSPSPLGQIVVTSSPSRSALRKLLEPELPDLPIVAHAELAPNMTVHRLAWISLS
jgi:hypothetical protein